MLPRVGDVLGELGDEVQGVEDLEVAGDAVEEVRARRLILRSLATPVSHVANVNVVGSNPITRLRLKPRRTADYSRMVVILRRDWPDRPSLVTVVCPTAGSSGAIVTRTLAFPRVGSLLLSPSSEIELPHAPAPKTTARAVHGPGRHQPQEAREEKRRARRNQLAYQSKGAVIEAV